MEFFDCEEIQWATNNQDIVLTNYRLRVESRGGIREIQSVLLPQILFCSLRYLHHLWLIVLAVLIFALAFVRQLPRDVQEYCFFAALLLFVVYLMTRRTVILVSTTGEQIPIPIRGKQIAYAVEIIDRIEHAILYYQPVLEFAGEATPDGSCREPRELTQPRPQFPFTAA